MMEKILWNLGGLWDKMLFDTHVKKLNEVLKRLSPPKTFSGKNIGLGISNTNKIDLAKENLEKVIRTLKAIK